MDILILNQQRTNSLGEWIKVDTCKSCLALHKDQSLVLCFFLIFLGDIDESVRHSFISSFADDTRIGKEVKTMEDSENLQRDLETLYKWTEDNNMCFNSSKFELLRYGGNISIKENTSYTTSTGEIIEEKYHVKDLGIFMSNTAEFIKHINHITSRTSQLSAWILRTFQSREFIVMLTLWKSLVLSIFNYCSQLYNPSKVSHIQQLEMIQRSYIRKINGMNKL